MVYFTSEVTEESTGSFDLPSKQKVGVGQGWEGNYGRAGKGLSEKQVAALEKGSFTFTLSPMN